MRRRQMVIWLAVTMVVIYAATLVVVASPVGAAVAVASHAVMVLPGLLAVRAAVPGQWLLTVTCGPMMGLGLSTVAMLALWAAGARGPWLLAIGPLLALAVCGRPDGCAGV